METMSDPDCRDALLHPLPSIFRASADEGRRGGWREKGGLFRAKNGMVTSRGRDRFPGHPREPGKIRLSFVDPT
ncbi:hypothetical protein TNCV_4428501 [Trichonephila clavipes]|nr:hypothetical protein TNCV_4428501 [Trichonephila clavipes]